MYSLLRYSLAATAVLSMAQGATAHPTANKQEKPNKVEGQQGDQAANAKALYFITNDDDNALAAIELGADGLITGSGAVYQTGGKGANGIDGSTNSSAAPDSLFSQSSLTVAGKHIFVVNAGSNSLSMFAIDEANPFSLEKVGEPILLPGEFPNTVAASEKNGLVCVGLTGQKAGISCAAFSAEGGLGEADGLREFQLGQSTPPVGPTNTVSQVFWSDDESHLLATVKGDPEKGNNGFFSAYAVQQGEPGAEANANFAGANGLDNKNQTQDQNQNQNQQEAEKQANKYNQAYNQANQVNPEDNKQNNLLANATGAVFGAADGEKNEAEAEKQDQNNLLANATGAAFGAADGEKNKAEAEKQGQNDLLDQQAGARAGAAFAISAQKFYVSRDEIRSSPEGTAVLFGAVSIPGTQNVLATDASFGVAVLSLLDTVLGGNNDQLQDQDQKQKQEKEQGQKQKQEQKQQKKYQTKGRLELPGQKATCWAAISQLTNSAFVTDVGRNKLVEVGGYNGDVNALEDGKLLDLTVIGEIDLSAVAGAEIGLIDLHAAGQFVYALSPGNGENGEEPVINVVNAKTKEFVQNAKLSGVGAGKNSMGMAVYI